MRDMGWVCGSEPQAKPLVFGLDTVYVHWDIQKMPELPNLFRYREQQYTYREYLELSEKQRMQDKAAFENALCELDMGGSANG